MKVRIIIIDDHPIVRDGMEAMLSSTGRFDVSRTFESGDEAVEWCSINGAPDLVLTDVRMPGMDGFDLLKRLKARFPSIKVLMLAGLPNSEEEQRAREMGACGYLSKSTKTLALANNIMRLAEGENDFVANSYTSVKTPFTPREQEVLRLLALGKKRDEVARHMKCAPETVKVHTRTIRQKLGVNNTSAAIARAYELGYLRR